MDGAFTEIMPGGGALNTILHTSGVLPKTKTGFLSLDWDQGSGSDLDWDYVQGWRPDEDGGDLARATNE